MEICVLDEKMLSWSDFHWFYSQTAALSDCWLQLKLPLHILTAIYSLLFRIIFWNIKWMTFYCIYVRFFQLKPVSGIRLPRWFVCLWSEIYDLVKVLNEQINRFVSDILRCIWKHLCVPLFCVHLQDRQFLIVIWWDTTVAAHLQACKHAITWKHSKAVNIEKKKFLYVLVELYY